MKLIYEKTRYTVDGSLAIRAWAEGEHGIEPYGNVTINLTGYGMHPEPGHIFIPKYKMSEVYFSQICEDIIEEVVCPVQIGYGMGVYAKLKPDWESNVELIEG